MSRLLTHEQIPDIARGAALLGTGGGGDPYVGRLLAQQALAQHGPVTVVTLAELPDDAVVIAAAMLGAPTVMVEKLPGLAEVVAPVKAVERHLGKRVTHLFCAEIGGVNSTIPIAAAAALGLPLLDADGMGRAFPELQMIIPTLYGVSAAPMGVADEKGNTLVMDTVDSLWAERITRVAAIEMGCSVMISAFVMDGAQARESLVPGSLSRCEDLSRAITQAREDKQDPVTRLVDLLEGRELFEGKVVDLSRKTTSGFARGVARIDSDAASLRLDFQNEHLVATLLTRDAVTDVTTEEALVTAPDLIMVLEADSGEPITTEGLRYGQRVKVIAAPSDPRWHSPEALAMVGPRYLGYDLDSKRFDGSIDPAPAAINPATGTPSTPAKTTADKDAA
ncbi:MAG: DUF917 domain-containing protein [Galactobacter sp.]